MNVTLWMATSLNGITAREDGSEDFLSSADWQLFVEMARASDALVWGRVTHELFEAMIRPECPEIPILVVTGKRDFAPRAGSMRASTPDDAVKMAAQLGAEKVLLAGGSQLNAGFARSGLIDEVVLGIEPVLVARGLPVIAGDVPDLRLDLIEVDQSHKPTLRVRYRVLKRPAARGR